MKCIVKLKKLENFSRIGEIGGMGFRCSTYWLMVGCSQPVLIAFMVAMASNPPEAPSACPIIDWKQQDEEIILVSLNFSSISMVKFVMLIC